MLNNVMVKKVKSIFVYSLARVVDLEVVTDLSVSTFLLAFHRFVLLSLTTPC